MKQETIWYSPSYKEYFVGSRTLECYKCNIVLDNILFHAALWDTKQSVSSMFCEDCIREIQTTAKVIEKKCIIAVNIVPDDAFPIFLTPPLVVDSRSKSASIGVPLDMIPKDRQREGDEDWTKAPISKESPQLSYEEAKANIKIVADIPEEREDSVEELRMISNAKHIRPEQIDTKRTNTKTIESK